MEKVTEFFKNLTERVSNPLLSSYLVSFLIVNWKFTIAIFLYNRSSIVDIGYKNYFDLVQKEVNGWYPLFFAICFTASFPWIKYIIKVYIGVIKSKADTVYYRKTSDHTMPISKFQQVKEEYDKQNKQLEVIVAQEKDSLNTINELRIDIDNKKRFIDLNTHFLDKAYWNGTWEIVNYRVLFDLKASPHSINYNFSDGLIYAIATNDSKTAQIRVGEYEVVAFNINRFIVVLKITSGKIMSHVVLSKINERQSFEGYVVGMNEEIAIKFEKH